MIRKLVFIGIMIFSSTVKSVEESEDASNGDSSHNTEHSPLFYRSPEERREVGEGINIAEWLVVSGLIEVERHISEYRIRSQGGDYYRQTQREVTAKTLQVALKASYLEWLELDLVYEYENQEKEESEIDELVISAELGQWGIKVGKQYLPFGEYFSHFATDPLVEFGETRARALVLDWAPQENVELSLYLTDDSVSDSIPSKASNTWGAALNYTGKNSGLRYGIHYLDNIGISQAFTLPEADEVLPTNTVPAVCLYFLWPINSKLEASSEVVGVLSTFADVEPANDTPWAFNWEISWSVNDRLQLSSRFERSRELEEAEEHNIGVSVAYRPLQHAVFSFDILRGRYEHGALTDENDAVIRRRTQFGLLLGLEF